MAGNSHYADLIMNEIDADIRDGIVPATVASVTGLHDYVDANDYFGWFIPDLPDGTFDLDTVNALSQIVNERLAARDGMRQCPECLD